MATTTARIAITPYVPPFAAFTTSLPSTTATTTVTQASVNYGTATTTAGIVDATGGVNSNSLLEYFTKPYIDAHTLSLPSWRYAYYFWFVIAGGLLICSIFVQLSSHGVIGSWWRSITMRRVTIGGGLKNEVKIDANGKRKSLRKKGWASPTFGTVLIVSALLGLCVALSFIGDDYISPTTCTFGGTCPYASGLDTGPPKTNYKRSLVETAIGTLLKRGTNNPNGWAPFNDPLLAGPNSNIARNLWTFAARIGLISYALIPLCISLALKQWPFNILSIPFLTNIHFDKSAILHRWSGRIVWMLASAHAGAWTYQLFIDKDPFGRAVFFDAWAYFRFFAGGVGYVVLTLLVLLSFKPIRAKYYELFYWSHIILAAVLCASCIIHAKPLAWWIIAGCALWGLERLTRFITLLWINGVGNLPKSSTNQLLDDRSNTPTFNLVKSEKGMTNGNYSGGYGGDYDNNYRDADNNYSERGNNHNNSYKGRNGEESRYPPQQSQQYQFKESEDRQNDPYNQYDDERYQNNQNQNQHQHQNQNQQRNRPRNQRDSYYEYGPGQDTQYLQQNNYPNPKFRANTPNSFRTNTPDNISQFTYSAAPISTLPPIGYSYCQVLPGRTIRLTLNTPKSIRFTPGQHLFLTIPSIALLQSHPYSITNVDERSDGIAPLGGTGLPKTKGTEIVLLIRAQKGFSKKLWKNIIKQREKAERNGSTNEVLAKGVKLRCLVSWPLGSAAGTDWGSHETVVIICGGTGITFGISILEYVCRRMARQQALGKEGRERDNFKTTRVRCIWTIREYAHLSWVAPTLRRCLEMTKASNLQLDIYVSRDDGSRPNKSRTHLPQPAFARSDSNAYESDMSDGEGFGSTPPRPSTDTQYEVDDSITDMIFFEGEDETPTMAELELSSKVRKQGKLGRARSRINQGYNKKSGKNYSQGGPTMPLPTSTNSPWKNNNDNLRPSENHYDYSNNSMPNRPPSFLKNDPSPSHSYNNNNSHANQNFYGMGASGSLGSFADLNNEGGGRNNRIASDAYSLAASSRRGLIDGEESRSKGEIDQEEIYVDLTEGDQADLDAVAELARPGYPKLEKIMDEEIAKSAGKIVVACCGPSALNTAVRNLVSSKINLKKIFKGDSSGSISLVCEDFSY